MGEFTTGGDKKRAASRNDTNKKRVNARGAAQSGARRGRKGPDWSMILALAVIVIILLGLIALIAIGINSCASGCGTQKSQPSGSPQIYPIDTPAPEATQQADDPVAPPQDEGEPVETAPPATARTGELRSATIRNIGDFVIHDVIFQSAAKLAQTTGVDYAYDFAPMLKYVKDVMGNADFTVANVDGSMGGKQYYRYGYSGYPQFNTPPHILYALADAGVDMLTLANNHMLDGWFDGLVATMDNVEHVGLKHVGASRTKEERDTPDIYVINDIQVGFMNYTVALNSMDKANGMDPRAMQFAAHATSNSNAFADAKALKDNGAEVIVCYMHWGTEYEFEPDSTQKSISSLLVEAGVDVIIGGHPHVVQSAKWLTGKNQFGKNQRTLCLFSLGNFLSDQRLQYRDGGVMFDFTIQEMQDGTFEIVSIGYLPTWVWRTGNETSGFDYAVMPAGQYLNQRPAGMSDADYSRMIASYQESVAMMSNGVGVILNK